MPRFFAPITQEEFRIKLAEAILSTSEYRFDYWSSDKEELLTESFGIPTDIAATDLAQHPDFLRVLENWTPINSAKITDDLSKVVFDWENYGLDEENPIRVRPSGMPYLVAWAGGDWENPVHYILYWDGKTIRAYLPEEGNTFNTVSRTAYGSEGENGEYEGEEWDGETDHEPDWNKFEMDIDNRIIRK